MPKKPKKYTEEYKDIILKPHGPSHFGNYVSAKTIAAGDFKEFFIPLMMPHYAHIGHLPEQNLNIVVLEMVETIIPKQYRHSPTVPIEILVERHYHRRKWYAGTYDGSPFADDVATAQKYVKSIFEIKIRDHQVKAGDLEVAVQNFIAAAAAQG